MRFCYFSLKEAEQFVFYRIPKQLIKDPVFKSASDSSKILYGLLLDRISLSKQNGWADENNNVYIYYTIDEICDDLNCSHQKAVNCMKELVNIGLVRKKRQGLGKPDMIFVMNFIYDDEDKAPEEEENRKDENENSGSMKIRLLDFNKKDDSNSSNHTSGIQNYGLAEVSKAETNKNNKKNINFNDINQSSKEKADDVIDDILLERKIDEQLEFSWYMENGTREQQHLFRESKAIIMDIITIPRKTLRINSTSYDYRTVRDKMLSITSEHIIYVQETLKNTFSEIKNIRAYLLTALFNAPDTIDTYYNQRYRYDTYGK